MGHRRTRRTVFGGCLHSDLDCPELASCDAPESTWTLRTVSEAAEVESFEYLGEDEVDPDIRVRLYRTGKGYLLRFDDTGDFRVSADGTEVEWSPAAGASIMDARIDLLGRVLPLAMHQSGTFCLHGSAVALETGAVGFIAGKFRGKSTLALALANAGARLITDDTIPVDPGPPARMRPGVPSLRLWRDSASRLRAVPAPDSQKGAKQPFVAPPDRVLHHPVCLSAIYLLSPVSGSRPAAVHRERLSQVLSALALIRHAKLGPLFGGTESVVLFRRATTLARTVPVYLLEVARDFERLPEVAAQLMEWHRATAETEQPLEISG